MTMHPDTRIIPALFPQVRQHHRPDDGPSYSDVVAENTELHGEIRDWKLKYLSVHDQLADRKVGAFILAAVCGLSGAIMGVFLAWLVSGLVS
jgi:hypothetical protein